MTGATAEPPAGTTTVRQVAGAAVDARHDLRNTLVLTAFTAFTNLADGVTKVAMPLLATHLTTSPLAISAVALTLSLPWLLCALPIGVLVDRYDRRKLVWLANGMRLLAVGALLGALAAGVAGLPVLYAVGLSLGVAEVIALTSVTALVPNAVTPPGRERANAWTTAAETVCNDFCGPAVGGVMVAVGLVFALGSTAIVFAVSLLILMLLVGRFRPAVTTRSTESLSRQVRDGVRLLWNNRLLRVMSLVLTVLCSCWGAWLGLIPVLATQELHLDAHGYGLVMSALGVGGVCGAASARFLNRVVGQRWTMFGDLLGTFAMVASPVLSTSAWVIGACAFLGGLGGTLWTVNARTIAQRLVPLSMMGRYHSAMRLFSWGALPLGSGLAGLLAEWVGLRAAFIVFAVGTAVLIVPFVRMIRPDALANLPATGDDPAPAATGDPA